ncbi:hypothetical protein [Aerosakkonema funiforme]|uniref:hypothetical protein n=1 Tax=Aerosakkonema funiforme TaxID=1246630 RepID=UPI0035B89C9C
MTKPEPDEKELQEILELAKEAEQKLREMTGGLTALAEKWQQRAEDKIAAVVQKQEV